jgi:hypothetical protein
MECGKRAESRQAKLEAEGLTSYLRVAPQADGRFVARFDVRFEAKEYQT